MHAEALDQARRDSVATKNDVRNLGDELRDEIQDLRVEISRLDTKIDNKIDVAVRDIKPWLGGIIIVAFGALASTKFFG